jgi:DHA1 family bicyclomycin/chloramphenicol resistance-like MFS transporter
LFNVRRAVYLTAAPFIIINKLHVSAAHFGYTQLPIFGTYILGAYCLGRVQDDLHIKQLIKVGIGLVLAASACMLLAGLIFGNHLISFILPMTIYTFGFSLCSSSLTAEVMDVGANSKGLTAAFLGFGMAVACVIGNALLSLVYNGTIYSVAGLLFVMTLIAGSFFLYQQLRRHAI